METVALKSNLLEIVDNIQDERLLQSLYELLKNREKTKTSKLWNRLTDIEKDEVLLAYEESENEGNLISAKEVFKKQ